MSEKLDVETAVQLAEWYEANKRSLLWRDTGDPFDVWVSEIMLQQTRIEAVREKFITFRKHIPDIRTLAVYDRDALMRLWEGLGYYSRAVNLQKCAQVLCEKYDAELPADYEKLLKLPGIGPYTAGAVASICFNIPVPAVDGNVLRVLCRYAGIRDDVRDPQTKQKVEKMLEDVYKSDISFSSFNQGLMELGETVCLPKGKTGCSVCPLREKCHAYHNDLVNEIPYRSPLKKRKIVERTLLVMRSGDQFLLHRRPASGLLAGLYEFPGVEKHLKRNEVIEEAGKYGLHPLRIRKLPDAKHIFTHLEWHMTAWEITVGAFDELHIEDAVFANKKELAGMAVPSAFKTYTDWYALRD